METHSKIDPTETTFSRHRYEISKSAMRALTENSRRAHGMDTKLFSQRDWFTYFETEILNKASDGLTNICVDIIWNNSLSAETIETIKVYLEKYNFHVEVYNKTVVVEW